MHGLADGEPIALMHNFLPTGLVHLDLDMLEQHGLYELLRASGMRLGSATQRMCAGTPPPPRPGSCTRTAARHC